MRLMVFSKHLAGPSFPDIARRLRQMDIREIDLTVRPGGHVEPERVEDELPRAAELLASEGVAIGMITTGITDAEDSLTPKVLRTAMALGIGHYKLGYFSYQGFGTLRKARDEARVRLQVLAQLNAEIGIVGGYHNHSDNFIGAALGDIDYLLADTNPQFLGLYFDPCHAVIEGGSQGWKMGLDLLQDLVVMLAAKDFRWVEAGVGYAGARRYSVQFCPFEEGNVPWKQVWECLHQIGFDGPVSLHSEYQGRSSFRDLNSEEVFEQTALDANIFRDLSQA